MNKYEIIRKIEEFAPPELAENWDCSGWAVETGKAEIKKVMLCLTVTEDIVKQAKQKHCDMIISHHPLFTVPLEWSSIDIYSAHTNLDRTIGGTTDTLINKIFQNNILSDRTDFITEPAKQINSDTDYLRYINFNTSIFNFIDMLKSISPNLRYVNNKNINSLKKIAFCAGSGSEFIQEAYENGADALVTGDLKFHTALDSPIVVFDIGHFESEILVLSVFEKLLQDVETIHAEEQSPFIHP